jgi:signal transduction histidine kinase/transcriptional regulator with GAF, ATPase, and Fis domain
VPFSPSGDDRAGPSPGSVAEALHHVTRCFAEASSSAAVAEAAVGAVSGLLGGGGAAVLLRAGDEAVRVVVDRGGAARRLRRMVRLEQYTVEGVAFRYDDAGGRLAVGGGCGAVVPLSIDGTPVGSFVVAAERPGALDGDMRLLLDAVASLCAEALRRERLLDRELRTSVQRLSLHDVTEAFSRAETAQDTIDTMLLAIRELAGPDGWASAGVADRGGVVRITRLEPHRRTFERWDMDPADPNLVLAAVLRDGRSRSYDSRADIVAEFPAYSQDLVWESGLVVPILDEDRAVGALALAYRTAQHLTRADRVFVRALATLCGDSLRRIRLRNAEAQAEARAAALHRVAEAFSRSVTVDEVLEVATAALLDALDAEASGAVLVEPDGPLRRWWRTPDGGLSIGSVEPALLEPALAAVVVRPTGTDDGPAPRPAPARIDDGRGVVLPLVVDGEAVGALTVRRGTVQAAEGHDALVESLAALCAEAVRRARLYDDERRAAARFGALHRLTDAFSRVATVDEVFAVAVEEIRASLAPLTVVASIVIGGRLRTVSYSGPLPRQGDGRAGGGSDRAFDVGRAVAAALRDGRVRWYEPAEAIAVATTSSPGTALHPGSLPWRSGAVLPILVDGDPVGIVGVGFGRARRLAAADRELLVNVVDLCREAVRRARDLERARDAAERFEQLSTSYERVIRNHAQPTLVFDADDLGIVLVNEAVVAASGYGEAELLGLRVTDLLHPMVRPLLEEGRPWSALRVAWPDSPSAFVPLLRKDGTVVPADAYGQDGSVIALGGRVRTVIFADQSARLHAEIDRQALQQRVAAVADEERRRIAADLHDGPVQQLSAVAMRLGALRRLAERGAAPPADRLETIAADVAGTVDELRTMLLKLYPPSLDAVGLGEAVRSIVLDGTAVASGRLGPDTTVTVEDRLVSPLPVELKQALFRVVLEALTNVVKHAGAHTVRVELAEEDQELVVRIADDGTGVSDDALRRPGHLGVAAMADRVSLLGGSFRIGRRPAGGTLVEARVPCPGSAYS